MPLDPTLLERIKEAAAAIEAQKRPKRPPSIVKDPPEIYAGRVWVAVNIRERGEFRVEMFSGKTAWEAEKLAKDRINEILS
jgi:hypothetical protein